MFLVTGATGHVGEPLVQRLSEAGVPVRAFCRHPERVAFPSGVETVAGEMGDAVAARKALAGVTHLFLLRAPGTEVFWHEVLASRVERVVLLSSAAVASPRPNFIGQMHGAMEDAVREAGMSSAFLRPGAFMSNALQWAPSIRAEGVVRAPFGAAVTAPVDELDLADAAAHLLLQGDLEPGQIRPVTGPEAITAMQQVAVLQEVLRHGIRFEELTEVEAAAQMKRFAPPAVVDALFAMMRDATVHPSLDVHPAHAITGQPARSFRQWAERHRAEFS